MFTAIGRPEYSCNQNTLLDVWRDLGELEW